MSEESDSDVSTSSDSDTSDSASESEAEITQQDLNALIDKARENAEAEERLLRAQEDDQDVITLDHDEQMWVVF